MHYCCDFLPRCGVYLSNKTLCAWFGWQLTALTKRLAVAVTQVISHLPLLNCGVTAVRSVTSSPSRSPYCNTLAIACNRWHPKFHTTIRPSMRITAWVTHIIFKVHIPEIRINPSIMPVVSTSVWNGYQSTAWTLNNKQILILPTHLVITPLVV